MREYGRGLLGAALILVIAGCAAEEESAANRGSCVVKQEFTLNPDGSGKVACEIIARLGRSISEKNLRGALKRMLRSDGVVAWADAACKRLDKDTIWFRGTAYFRDISILKFGSCPTPAVTWESDIKGGMVLTLRGRPAAEASSTRPKPKLEPEQLRDAEMAAKVKHMRRYHAARRARWLKRMAEPTSEPSGKLEFAFRLPGRIDNANLLEKEGDGVLRFTLDLRKCGKAADEIVADDASLRRLILAGETVTFDSPGPALAGMFKKGPVRARVAGGLKPLFDFDKEVAAAEGAYAGMCVALGLVPAKLPEPGEGGTLTGFKVTGIHYRDRFGDAEAKYPVYVIKMTGNLSKPAWKAPIGEIHMVIAADGEVVLPRLGYSTLIRYSRIGREDNKRITFTLNIPRPRGGAKRLRDITGVMTVATADPAKEIDLGITEFTVGAEGTRYSAVIRSVRKRVRQGKETTSVSLTLNVPYRALGGLRFYDADGNELKSRQSSRSALLGTDLSGAQVSNVFEIPLPEKVRITAIVHENYREFDVPFRIIGVLLPE